MRKILFFLLTLCMILGLCLTAQAEDVPHPHSAAGHCVCGGAAEGVGDHQCSTVTDWTPLSEDLDFGKLESGAYYLTCDIKLTKSPNIIGDMTGVDTDDADEDINYYVLDKAKTITLCLNGYTLSTTRDRVFKGVGQQSVLNICDCSYDGNAFYGTIIGGSSPNGPICYTYSTSTLNIYGGNFTAPEHSGRQHGGLFAIAQDRFAQGGSTGSETYASTANIYNGYLYGGVAQAGGNINVMHSSILNIYGGTIADGTVKMSGGGKWGYGGNICIGSNATLKLAGTAEHPVLITGGTAELCGGNIHFINTETQPTITTGIRYANSGTEVAFVRNSAGTVTGQYLTLAEALEAAAAKTGSTVYMVADSHVPTTLSQSVPIDLNGHHITNLTLKADLYALDSVTQYYTDPGAGTLECTAAGGQVVTSWKTADLQRYLALQEEGKYSFHRIYLGITKLSLRPGDVGFGYKAHFAGSETVKNVLGSYGFRLWLEGRQSVTRAFAGDKLTGGQELSLLLSNFDVENYAEEPVYANVFFTLKDGTEIETNPVSYDFRTMCEKVDSIYASQALPLRRAIDKLSGLYSHTMMSWDIASYHHAKDSLWYSKGKSSAAFLSMLKEVTIGGRVYYNVPAGTYYLTEDVDLGSKTLRIAPNTTVTICLNGHTLTSSSRVIRNYGTLNLYDCHTDDCEGGITGTQTITSGEVHGTVMYCYYNSTTNLYGGKLTGTGARVTNGGSVAVSHDGTGHEADPAAVFNMYGGEISSTATVEKNGGALVMFNGATFNLYDGVIRGTTANMGGAVHTGNGTFRMYGGTVTGGTSATTGGNIHVAGSGTLELYGGTITGGKASEGGSGVYVLGKNTVLSGTPQVTGNQADDLHLSNGAILNTVNLSTGANVNLSVDGNAPLVCHNPVSITGLSYSNPGFTLKTFNGKLLVLENGVSLGGTTSGFSAGFSKVLITPEEVQGHYEGNPIAEGVPLSGFGRSEDRAVDQYVGYDLYVTTTAVTDAEGNTILIAACDLQRPQKEVTDVLRAHMSAVTGVPVQNIYINASHSHSTPDLYSGLPVIDRYKSFLAYAFAKSARLAMADRAPATVQTGSFEVTGGQNGTDLNHTRHYYYTDANGQTHYFGDNFNSAPSDTPFYHVTRNDPTMHLLKFDRETKTDILLCNWRAHPTMTGSATIPNLSSDFVGPMRDKTEELTGMHVAFIQGAAGNQNTNSKISGEGLAYNATLYPYKSQARANYYGHTLAAQVGNNLDCLAPVASGTIRTETYTYTATVNHAEDSRIEDARKVNTTYWDTAEENRPALLAQYGFTSVYHAGAVVSKYNLGATKDIEINAFSIGDTLGFYTAPGELWNTISVTMEDASPFDKTFTVGYCNGDDKYFLYGAALTYDNYEGYYSRFVGSTAQDMINYWTAALNRLQDAG